MVQIYFLTASNLFNGQTCVERGIPAGEAVERLVELIREHGAWVEA